MSLLRWLAEKPRAKVAPALALAMAGMLGGCSARSEYSEGYGYYSAPAPAQRIAATREEIEDDGLPSQTPPLMRTRKLPDNPAEPFSPNYGGPASRQAAIEPRPQRERAVASAIPDDLPPDFRRRLQLATGE
jgi:hypothetical protein